MASKRNKLLVFLGLVTVVVSKSHNQRFIFEHEFESRRTNASTPSANTRHMEPRSDISIPLEELLPSESTRDYREHLLRSGEDHSRTLQESSGTSEVLVPGQRSDSSRLVWDDVQNDSSDLPFGVDPVFHHFDPKKLNRKKSQKKSARDTKEHSTRLLIRRSGDAGVQQKQNDKDQIESKKENGALAQESQNKTMDPNEKVEHNNGSRTGKKKIKGKRKKVLRVRHRQGKNKTKEHDEKIDQTPLHKQKLLIVDATLKNDQSQLTTPPISDANSSSKGQTEGIGSKSKRPNASFQAGTVKSNRPETKLKTPPRSFEAENLKSNRYKPRTRSKSSNPSTQEGNSKLNRYEQGFGSEKKLDSPTASSPTWTSKSENVATESYPKYSTAAFQSGNFHPNEHEAEMKTKQPTVDSLAGDFDSNRFAAKAKLKPTPAISNKENFKFNAFVTKKKLKTPISTAKKGDSKSNRFTIETNLESPTTSQYEGHSGPHRFVTETKQPTATTSLKGNPKPFRLVTEQPALQPGNPEPPIFITETKSPYASSQNENLKPQDYGTGTGLKFPTASLHAEKTRLDKSKMAKKEEKNQEDPEDSDDGHVVTFFRRTGDKIVTLHDGNQDYPQPEWVSMYQTENRNKEGNFYVLSFNYMGNKNLQNRHPEPTVPKTPAKQRKQHTEAGYHEPEYPKGELDIKHLEETAGLVLEHKKKKAEHLNEKKVHRYPKDHAAGYRDEKYHDPKQFESPDEWVGNLDSTDKQLTPTVTLKRKKLKKNKEAVWKMQAPKKKFPEEGPEHTLFENDEFGESEVGSPNGYFVRSFLKLPSGENVALNLEDGQLGRVGEYEEVGTPAMKPLNLSPPGNEKYFLRMYKTLGDVENFDTHSGENNGKFGYLSNLRVSWADDDTLARVEETTERSTLGHLALDDPRLHEDQKDYFPVESSENIMHYKSHYADDFHSALNGDASYYADSLPFFHRYRRSVEQTPRIVSHFKLGDSTKFESNHTLEHMPAVRFRSQRLKKEQHHVKQAPGVHHAPQINARYSGAQTEVIEDKDSRSKVKSYYYRPVDKARSKTEFRMSENGKDDEQEERSLDTDLQHDKARQNAKNKQIFHAYQGQGRGSGPAHDITFYHDSKNTKVDMKIIAKGEKPTLRPVRAKGGKSKSFSNFGVFSNATVIHSSTDIRNTYVHPDNASTVVDDATATVVEVTSPLSVIEDGDVTIENSVTGPPKYEQFFNKYVEIHRDDRESRGKPVNQSEDDSKDGGVETTSMKPQKQKQFFNKNAEIEEGDQEHLTESESQSDEDSQDRTIEETATEPSTYTQFFNKNVEIKKGDQEYLGKPEGQGDKDSQDRKIMDTTTKPSKYRQFLNKNAEIKKSYQEYMRKPESQSDEESQDTTIQATTKEPSTYAQFFNTNVGLPKVDQVFPSKPVSQTVKDRADRTTEKPSSEFPEFAQFFNRYIELQREDREFLRKPSKQGAKEQRSSTVHEEVSKTTIKPTTASMEPRFKPKARSVKPNRPSILPPMKQAGYYDATASKEEEGTTLKPSTEQRAAVTLFAPRLRPSKPSRHPTKQALVRAMKRITPTTTASVPVIEDRMDQTQTPSSTQKPSTYNVRRRNQSDRPPVKSIPKNVDHNTTGTKSKNVQDRADQPTESYPKATSYKQFFRRIFRTDGKDLGSTAAPAVQSRQAEDKDWGYASDDSEEDSQSRELQQDVEDHLKKNSDWSKDSLYASEGSSEEYEGGSVGGRGHSKVVTPKVPFFWDNSHNEIQTKAGRNYPMHHTIPKTGFTCKGRKPGYYADPDAGCQVFHMCHGAGSKHSFLCPNTTIFNQELLVCDWHSKVNCGRSESLYSINDNIYKQSPKEEGGSPKHQPWKHRNYKTADGKHQESKSANYLSEKQQDSKERVPKFIVERLRDEVPNAEIGRPRSVTKSYSTVISRPKSVPSSSHHGEKKPAPEVRKNVEIKLVPQSFLDKQKAIKDSWTFQDVEKVLNQQLLMHPEPDRNIGKNEGYGHYSFSGYDRPRYDYTQDENVHPDDYVHGRNNYYVPEIESFEDSESHVAGRNNGNLIIVNRKRLRPGYDSSEAPESETSINEDAFSQLEYPKYQLKTESGYDSHGNVLRYPARGVRYNDHPNERKIGNSNIKNEFRFPQTEKDQGVRGFRIIHAGAPKAVDQQKARVKLNGPVTVSGRSTEYDPQAQKIQLRIKEIKTGIEDIMGSQLGNILGGKDTDFKNVKIYKLKPYGSHEEINLPPFRFERNNDPPYSPKDHHETFLESPLYDTGKKIQARHSEKFELLPGKLTTTNAKEVKLPKLKYVKKISDPDRVHIYTKIPKVVQEVSTNSEQMSKPALNPKMFHGTRYSYHHKASPVEQPSRGAIKPATNRDFNGQTTLQKPYGSESTLPREGKNKASLSTTVKHEFNENERKYIPLIRLDRPTKANVIRRDHYKQHRMNPFTERISEESTERVEHVSSLKDHPNERSAVGFLGDTVNAVNGQEGNGKQNYSDLTFPEIQNPAIHAENGENKFKENSVITNQNEKSDITFPTPSPTAFPHPTVKIFKPFSEVKDKRTFVLISKPKKALSNTQMKDPKAKYSYKVIKRYPKVTELTKKGKTSDCDESDDDSLQSVVLGKNGPSVKISSEELQTSGDIRSYYNPKQDRLPKCRKHRVKPEDDHRTDFKLIDQKDSKWKPISDDLGQGLEKKVQLKHSRYTGKMARPKLQDVPKEVPILITPRPELLRSSLRPAKLFDFQRSPRPAFLTPFTTPKPILDIEDRYPTRTEPPIENPREVHGGKHVKYASLEREAELKTDLTPTNGQVKFSAARKSPQGRIVPTEDSEESSDSQFRQSRYAELEKEAELKAERMIKAKKYDAKRLKS